MNDWKCETLHCVCWINSLANIWGRNWVNLDLYSKRNWQSQILTFDMMPSKVPNLVTLSFNVGHFRMLEVHWDFNQASLTSKNATWAWFYITFWKGTLLFGKILYLLYFILYVFGKILKSYLVTLSDVIGTKCIAAMIFLEQSNSLKTASYFLKGLF